MTMFFSPSTGGFYDDVMKADYEAAGSWPDDVTPVSDRWYQYLIQGQSDGKIITVNEYGQPVLSDPAPPSTEQLIQEAETRKTTLMQAASDAIAPLQDAVDLDIATSDENALLLAWKKYRVLLNRVDTNTAPDVKWPETPVS
ncbi:tail fiber assembly protein [Citrobacter koseri]|uniref:tail fiber assembly protein n=1 Tax=Citrobacter koseri TaxID=545 RepID=UPI001901A307|nr:tail fiber assembly protein [Citrobacter koseri]MBJ9103000.1 tail fiber assembly protein [Citrobacter koseri]